MSRNSILIVEDDQSLMKIMAHYLEKSGYSVISFLDGKKALKQLPALLFDLALLDVNLGEVSGFEILKAAKREFPDSEVIMLTAYSQVDDAVRAMKSGAFDYLSKPVSEEDLLHHIKNALEKRALRLENTRLKSTLSANNKARPLIGSGTVMQELQKSITVVAKENINVLIHGESGTGKELVAREIHNQSPRREEPFVAINCAAIPENLMESEFFGHVKGAFTGATADRIGKMAAAEGGTLFLDEIGELPLHLQAKLLRALQEREITPVGSEKTTAIDIRLISATNVDLSLLVRQKRFREDLYYRIAVYPLFIPPLRERMVDLESLIEHFTPHLSFDKESMTLMRHYSWPGNVRELENALAYIKVNAKNGRVIKEDLPAMLLGAIGEKNLSAKNTPSLPAETGGQNTSLPTLDQAEKDLLLRALKRHHYNQSHAARALGITRAKLIYKMKKHGIRIERKAV